MLKKLLRGTKRFLKDSVEKSLKNAFKDNQVELPLKVVVFEGVEMGSIDETPLAYKKI